MSAETAHRIVVPDGQVDDVLSRAADDWVWAASIFDAARLRTGSRPEDATDDATEDASETLAQDPTQDSAPDVIERAIALMGLLLREGLLRPGRIAFGRFRPWPCSTEEAIEHIAAHWRSLPYRPGTLDFFVWFEATELGLECVERVMTDEETSEEGEEEDEGSNRDTADEGPGTRRAPRP